MAQITQFHLEKCPSVASGLSEDCSCDKEEKHYLGLAGRVVFVSTILLVGGFSTDSTALISEGVHQLVDSIESIVNAIVSRLVRKGNNENNVRMVGGKISAVLLLATGVWIISEGVERIQNPQPVHMFMMGFALFGLGITFWLRKVHHGVRKEHINLSHLWQDRHLRVDLAINGSVLIGGIVMGVIGGWYWIDGLIAICIGVLVVILTGAKLLGVEIHSHDHGSECNHKH